MQDVVDGVSKPGALVFDPFCATFPTAKVCLELLRHLRLVGCKLDAESFVESMEALSETYTRQVLSGKSKILCTDDVVDVCKIAVRGTGRVASMDTDEIVELTCWILPA